jgi:hypothetical protein
MYTTAGTAERTFVSKYIEPGVHRVRIAGIEGVDSDTGASYVQITFEDVNERTAQIRFYMSELQLRQIILKTMVQHWTHCLEVNPVELNLQVRK